MFGCVWREQGGEGGIFQKTHLLWKVFFFTISDLFIDLFYSIRLLFAQISDTIVVY